MNIILTNAGEAAILNNNINFTSFKFGSGVLTDIKNATDIADPVLTVNVNRFSTSNNTATVGALLTNKDFMVGKTITELGLYIDGGSVLFGYGVYPSPEVLSPFSEGLIEIQTNITFAVSSEAEITATISTGDYASISHITDPDAHYEIFADFVPKTRKINNKSLSADISLTSSDVGAAPSIHTHSYNELTNKPDFATKNYVDDSTINYQMREIVRYTTPGRHTFNPAEHTSRNNIYIAVLLGGGGGGNTGYSEDLGKYASCGVGGSGAMVITPPMQLTAPSEIIIGIGGAGNNIYGQNAGNGGTTSAFGYNAPGGKSVLFSELVTDDYWNVIKSVESLGAGGSGAYALPGDTGGGYEEIGGDGVIPDLYYVKGANSPYGTHGIGYDLNATGYGAGGNSGYSFGLNPVAGDGSGGLVIIYGF